MQKILLFINGIRIKYLSKTGLHVGYLAIATFFVFFPLQIFAACPKCNVILISMDTVGAKHLSLYGASRKTTPNIDNLAKISRVYKNAYAAATWTLASHGSMLTGMYPNNLYSPKKWGYLSDSIQTMAEILKKNGYKTAAYTDGYYLTEAFKFNRGFELFEAQSTQFKNIGMKPNLKKSIRFIQKHKKQPFFLFLHTYDAHEPFTPGADALRAIGGGEQKLTRAGYNELIELNLKKTPVAPEVVENVRLLHQAEIFEIDEHLGSLFRELNKLDLMKNTIVIITSDHGEEIGEHGGYGLHGLTSYNEILHIPLVLYVPNSLPKEILSPVSLVDILPTVLDQIKIKDPSRFDGVLLPEIDNIKAMNRKISAEGPSVSSSLGVKLFILYAKFNEKHSMNSNKQYVHTDGLDVHTAGLESLSSLESVIITNNKKFISSRIKPEITVFDLLKDPNEKNPRNLKLKFEGEALEIFSVFMREFGR